MATTKKTAAKRVTTTQRTTAKGTETATGSNQPVPTPDKPTSAAKRKGKAKAGGKGTKLKVTSDGPGVIGSIVEFLQGATASKPLTKSALRGLLVKRFPDRGEVALTRTLNCQLPSRLRNEKGLNVQTTSTDDGKGYWIK